MANVITIKRGAGVPPPDSLREAELALDTTTGDLYTKLGDGSVALLNDSAGGGGNGAPVHIGELPPADPQEGDQWLEIPATGDAVMWIYDGEKWLQQPSNGGGGGIEEAPEDGLQYVRQDAGWAEIVVPDAGGIEEAPIDGKTYVRKDGAWESAYIPPEPINVSGGTVATYQDPNDNLYYRSHTFESSGQFTVSMSQIDVEFVVIGAGGGGGGSASDTYGGGGGGGGFKTGTATLAKGQHAVTIGAGGAIASNGGSSTFSDITMLGGGGGGGLVSNGSTMGDCSMNSSGTNGKNGGSGGGGGLSAYGGLGTAGQGHDGCGTLFSTNQFYLGGGGGGAGGMGPAGRRAYTAGSCGNPSDPIVQQAPIGGPGLQNHYKDGSSVWYCGGGGGGSRYYASSNPNYGKQQLGGSGSGGSGDCYPNNTNYGGNGITPGGGGGGAAATGGYGGTGANGIVIIRYLDSEKNP